MDLCFSNESVEWHLVPRIIQTVKARAGLGRRMMFHLKHLQIPILRGHLIRKLCLNPIHQTQTQNQRQNQGLNFAQCLSVKNGRLK